MAIFSLFAFVTGNMVGQHGWQVFWKSVLGEFDDSLIVYEGTVTPLAQVPNYTKWIGNSYDHTWQQVPEPARMALPAYDEDNRHPVYSVNHMGSYKYDDERAEGSHNGIDIRVPEGTPVRAIANGIVTRISNDPAGFGKYIVIRHPHMPDPANPKVTTVLHSTYAHLSSVLVSEGMTIRKGEDIGASGKTGFASGPHLHFQIDRDEAPWHPYWPFTTFEMREAKMNFTQAINAGLHRERGALYSVNPMLLVQANYSPVLVASERTTGQVERAERTRLSVKERRALRIKQREARLIAMGQHVAASSAPSVASSPIASPIVEQPVIVQRETVAATDAVTTGPQGVAQIEFRHDGEFSRGWEKVRVRLLDANGQIITSPLLRSDIYLRTAYGKAEFRPEILSVLDFEDGEVVIDVLPRSRGTVVIQAQPTGEMSAPMKYVDQ
ncbi:M23 family metallopeptidase [Candidatus Peregrinibacteria bacterium]|nr:M23 family metallopeptidase [Candidatus Peregrinibacteria bacterium]